VDDAGITTTSSNCFSGMVNLGNGNRETTVFRGSTNFPEACRGMQAGDTTPDEQFLPNALWASTENSVQAGMILQMHEDLELLGGNSIVGSHVVYPVAVVTGSEEPFVYVASMLWGHPLERSDFYLMISNLQKGRFMHSLPKSKSIHWLRVC
jgi:hypothetical protein